MKTIRTAANFAIGAALAVFSCAGLAQEKVTVGIVTALTGPLAAPGKFQLNGFQLAVDEINGAGGFSVGGRKYTL